MVQDRHVLALDKARLFEALPESPQKLLVLRCGGEDPDYRHLRLLRARRERPGYCSAADQCDERASPHSITSSASNWIELGTSRPIVLAVCALMRSSNLVNCKAGGSAGFAPLRI